MIFELIIALIGLFFSILFSSSEIALISANNLQLKVWTKQNIRGSNLALNILLKSEEYLTAILIGTTLSNILATSFATIYFSQFIKYPVLIILLIAGIILFFGEILPKTITREAANRLLIINAPLLYVFRIICKPIIALLRYSKWGQISQSLQGSREEIKQNRDDLQHLYEQVNYSKGIEKDQQEMISHVFEFSESSAEDAMTPRTDISAIPINSSLEEIMHVFLDSGHSKIPVYKDNLDNITGIIYLYDLYKSPEDIQDIIKPAQFIPYSKSVKDTLKEFQAFRHAMAIVLDEHGGTAGIVTTEDLFEELFGEFDDEFDIDYNQSEILSDGSIITTAKMEWDQFNEKHGELIPKGEYETIGGYIISITGRIPNMGERLFLPIGQVVIRKATSRMIEQVQIFLNK